MEIVFDFPAYVGVRYDGGELKPGDEFGIPYQSMRHGTLVRFYRLGSVEAYAAKYGEDAEAAVADAKARGHELYWANGCSVVLHNGPKTKKAVWSAEYGDVIRFAGKRFRVDRAPNYNVKLVEVE